MLGIHVSKDGRDMQQALRDDLQEVRAFGVRNPCAQIFVVGPQNYRETLTETEKRAVRVLIQEKALTVVIHGSYVDFPWTRKQGAIYNIKREMRIANQIGAQGVIVHLGNGAADSATLGDVIARVTDLPREITQSVTLWLEINATKASPQTFETPAKLSALFESVADANSHGMQIGLCVDTAHLWSCGVSLAYYETAQEWLDGLPTNIPIMFHLNDSSCVLGSGIDKHELLAQGNIWNPDDIENSGLLAILEYIEEHGSMAILERRSDVRLQDVDLLTSMGYFI